MAAQQRRCDYCLKVQDELPAPLRRYGRCKDAYYCSKECQTAAWPIHKIICTAADGRKNVLLVELQDHTSRDFRYNMYEAFHKKMSQACRYKKITDLQAVVGEIKAKPNAVLVYEPTIMNQEEQLKYQAINETLVAYAKVGGTVVFGGRSCVHVLLDDQNRYFETVWGLPWKVGGAGRYEYRPNPNAATINGKPVPQRYNAKCSWLKNVNEDAAVYLQGELIRAGNPQTLQAFTTYDQNPVRGQGPVVWQKYGEGWVGWTGDLNYEKETEAITMMMCGVA